MTYVLLPTFNGARYLPAQLASLQRQSAGAWRLLVRDDGSDDGTVAIVDACARADARVERVQDGFGRLGCVGNVARLMQTALGRGARAVLLADQDDVWREHKIAATLDRLRAAEARLGADHPVLVHTDLAVVDEVLGAVDPSFMRFQRIRHQRAGALRTLLVQNFVTGCTTGFNRALLELALPVPGGVPMHDWWLALCAAAAGELAFIDQATVLYRQHTANTLAGKGYLRRLNPIKTSWPALWRRSRITHQQAVEQARALATRLTERGLTVAAAAEIRAFLSLFEPGVGGCDRVRGAWRLKLQTQHPVRTALLYARLAVGGSGSGLAGLTAADAGRRGSG